MLSCKRWAHERALLFARFDLISASSGSLDMSFRLDFFFQVFFSYFVTWYNVFLLAHALEFRGVCLFVFDFVIITAGTFLRNCIVERLRSVWSLGERPRGLR